jgi:hypothetical protein
MKKMAQPIPGPPRAQADSVEQLDDELEQTGLHARRPGQWQRAGDVARRISNRQRQGAR